MFQAPPKVPSGTAPTGATKGEKVGPDADLNTLKGNKVSPRRAIGHIAPEPISSPTVTAPSAEVISNSPGSSSKKGNKNQKVKLGEAVELEEEKPKLQNAQVYSFKELQESGFAFDDENDIDLSDYNSESYESESIGTPKTAEVREAEPATSITEHYLHHSVFITDEDQQQRLLSTYLTRKGSTTMRVYMSLL